MPPRDLLVVFNFEQLCRRILDVDEDCDRVKGCPYHIVVVPMLHGWRKRQTDDIPAAVEETLQRMLMVDGQGRWCEYPEVSDLAEEFLRRSGGIRAG